MRDIAKSLSLSHSTVSRALRDDPRISPPVREKVQAEARRVGYRPDPALSALAHYRSGKSDVRVTAEIAWAHAWPQHSDWRRFREWSLRWKGASEAAERSGYRLEEFRLGGSLSDSRVESILQARNIKGVLALGHTKPLNWADGFHWERFTVVRFGCRNPKPQAPVVSSDHASNSLLAFQRMRERGYARVGLVTGEAVADQGKVLMYGFLVGQSGLPSKLRVPALLLDDESSWSERAAQLKAWMEKNRPDAIFTDIAVLREMLEAIGYRVPEDVGLAANSVLDGNADAGIDQNSEEIGRMGFLVLRSLLLENQTGTPAIVHHTFVAGTWVDGSTLPPR